MCPECVYVCVCVWRWGRKVSEAAAAAKREIFLHAHAQLSHELSDNIIIVRTHTQRTHTHANSAIANFLVCNCCYSYPALLRLYSHCVTVSLRTGENGR